MAKRKRASMREGPLADLFRSTTEPADQQPPVDPRPESQEPSDYASMEASENAAYPSTGAEPAARPEPSPSAPGREAEEPPVDRSAKPAARSEPSPGAPGREAEDVPAGMSAEEPAFTEPARPLYESPFAGDSESAPDASERISRVLHEEPIQDHPSHGSFGDRRSSSGVARAHSPIIRVVGVGGGGVNAINRMVDAQIPGVEFMAVNTDLQSLQLCIADSTVHIGGDQTRGLGAGSDPDVGYRAAFSEQDRIKRLLKGSDMVFVAAGAGGGTGSGAAPVVARLAREVGALTVGIVTRPFSFEGSRRGKQAAEGIEALGREVDTLIIVPNDRLLEVLDQQTSMIEAFQVADDVLRQGVQGISDLVTLPAVINLDFADVRTIMSDAGQALLGIGMGTGDGRAQMAAEKAISSPLLETSMEGARAILLSITGGSDLSLVEVSEAATVVNEAAHQDANIIFGANIDEDLEDQVWVTVVATRFETRSARPPRLSDEAGTRRGEGLPSRGTRAERSERGGGRGERSGRGGGRGTRRGGDEGDSDLDIPEFLPN